jgi:hypothetical protein
MAIGSAVERGHIVYVYDEEGRQLRTLLAGNGPDDGLQGYTANTVNLRRGAFIYTYDAQGNQLHASLAE